MAASVTQIKSETTINAGVSVNFQKENNVCKKILYLESCSSENC